RGGSDEIVPLDVWSQCKKHVWSLAINDSQTLVVSGGGDGSIRLWSLEAAFGKRVESEDVLIPVELPSQDTYLDPNISMPRPNEHIRGFALSSWNSSIVVTDSGYVLTNNLALNSWSTLYHSHSLVGYSMVATLPTGDLVAVGMLDGSVLLVSPANLFTPILHRLHTSKVQHLSLSSRPNSCTADKVFDLVTCDANGSILWTQALYGGELSWTAVATLTVPGRSQLSSVAVSKSLGWAAAGTANGNLFVYDLPSKLSGVHVEHFCIGTSEIPNLAPSISWHQAHGKYTVSTIAVMPSGTPGGCTVFTGGRDGVLNKFSVAIGSDQVAGSQARMASSQLRHGSAARQQTMYTGTLKNRHGLDPTPAVVVSRISTEKLTQGWIEQIAVHRDSLFAVTFYRKRLVLLDLLASSETLSIACGGAGRSWQVLLTESGIRVGFIKKRLLLTYGLPSAPKSISNPVVSDGVSSVDIRAISATLLPEMDGDVIVASGGEDCFLRVHKYSCPNSSPQQYPSFETLGQIRRHTSAIRCLEFAQPESASGATASYRYLFSAGASCELRCWRMEFTRDSRAINTKLVEWALAPLLGNDADSRIMDISVVEQWLCEGSLYITVAAGYSDASVRLWQLDVNRHQFICIAHDSSKAHNHCVLSVEHLALPDAGGRTLLFTGATNGQIAIWDITKFMGVKPPALSDSQPSDIGPAACMCEGAHMSGVNALDIMQIAGSGGFLVASGGDDNSISVNEFELDGDKGIIKQRAAGSHANAHASTVQAVRFVDGRIWSVSTDQRVAVWAVAKKQPSGVFGFELCDMAYTQVADPSSMAITQVPDRQMCLVAGIGVEAFELQGSGMDFMISTDSS
ncbi:WD repeat-containing protein 6, partial [Dipsacomyces acuminosporus]